jgi:hypothetical protein
MPLKAYILRVVESNLLDRAWKVILTTLNKKRNGEIMPIIVRKKFEAELVDFLIDTYFKGDVKAFSAQVLSTENQIAGWRSGRVKPQKWQLRSMLSHTLVPEIKVVAEYQRVEFKTASDVSQLMRQVLQGHLNTPGIYAFYDSM